MPLKKVLKQEKNEEDFWGWKNLCKHEEELRILEQVFVNALSVARRPLLDARISIRQTH